jgi:hypothetical protein
MGLPFGPPLDKRGDDTRNPPYEGALEWGFANGP